MLDLVQSIERGLDREDNIRNFHKWAYDNLPVTVREWDETKVHSSDLGVIFEGGDTVCDRKLWLRINGHEKKPVPLGKKIMFDHGIRIQIRYSYIVALGLPDEWEVKDIFHIISEHAESDLVLTGPPGDMIIELKTARGRAFKFMDDARPRHKLQNQTYMKDYGTDLGRTLYIDREGQNKPVEFPVNRDDDLVDRARVKANSIAEQELQPEVIDYADVEIRENSTKDNSVKISLPWQCVHCPFYKHGCEGVLPEEAQKSGIVGRIDDDGNFYSEEYPDLVEIWEQFVYESEDYQSIHGNDSDE